jgi:hypothetical protein
VRYNRHTERRKEERMKEETDIKITQHKEKKKYGETENKTRQRA